MSEPTIKQVAREGFEKTIGRIERLELALRIIKDRVCGEAHPNWENTPRTGASRMYIADVCDSVLPQRKDQQP